MRVGVLAASLGLALPAGADIASRELQNRLELQALMQTINAEILASSSATLTLEDWCDRLALADDPTVRVRFVAGSGAPASAETRRLLEVGPGEPVGHRRVRLVCGQTVLSEADNWYVPGRLTEAMNHTLGSSETSFGKVIRPLRPARRTIGFRVLFRPLPVGWEAMPDDLLASRIGAEPPLSYDPARPLFEHRALVRGGDGRPLALVRETYRMALIAAGFD